MLDRQINCYSVDTGNFYTNHERRLHWRNKQFRSERSYLHNKIKRLTKQLERKRHTVELGQDDIITTALSLYRQSKCSGVDPKYVKRAERELAEFLQRYELDLDVMLAEDYEADIDDKVRTMAMGVVKKIYYDNMLGNVVVIEHSSSVESYYCGLAKTTFVQQGEVLNAGDFIGTVYSIPCETSLKPHIHVAVKENGKWADPDKFMKSSDN